MSKSIAMIAGGAPAALMQAASTMLSKATGGAVTAMQATSAATGNGIVIGTQAPHSVYACVAEPPRSASGPYSGVQTVVVRAILPRGAPDSLQVRDTLDVYPASGIDCEAELSQAVENFSKAAKVAVDKAKAIKATRVTLVTKPATKYANLNKCFLETATKAIEAAGLAVETASTAAVTNGLILFPEKYGVIMVNDDPICENVQHAYAGIIGGAHTTYYTDAGSTVYGGHSYKSVAMAISEALKAMGMKAEASKIEAAAQKNPRNAGAAM